MLSIVVYCLAFVGLLALIALALAILADDGEFERARLELEVRRAERQIHDIARDGLRAMLDEARTQGRAR